MISREYFISCDWGTSNFRLRLVKANSLEILEECNRNQGIKTLFEEFQKQKELNKEDFFADFLVKQIQLLPPKHQRHLVVLAGMVSSNIGLHELDYALIPFSGDGSDLNSKFIKLNNGLELLMISGVKNEQGMMRGEETQAIGLEDYLRPFGDGVLLLPGTHSKHITYKKGKFVGLKNYMTGELFEILSQKSILSNSIEKGDMDDIIKKSFKKGVLLGNDCKLSSSIFSIRANDLSGNATKEENYYFLSGLLLGDELSYLKKETKKIFLASPYPLANLYKIALDIILGSGNYILFDSETVSKAILIGQKKILESYDK